MCNLFIVCYYSLIIIVVGVCCVFSPLYVVSVLLIYLDFSVVCFVLLEFIKCIVPLLPISLMVHS